MQSQDIERRSTVVHRLYFSQLRRPIDGLVEWYREGQLDVDPPYQRQPVWGLERKQNLIRSLIIGLPIGAIFLNERGYKPDAPHYAVIDGKQRILTVAGFLDEEFSVPGEWFEAKYVSRLGSIYYSELTDVGRRCIMMDWTVATYETQFRWGTSHMFEQERFVFDLVNFGGVAQGEQDSDA